MQNHDVLNPRTAERQKAAKAPREICGRKYEVTPEAVLNGRVFLYLETPEMAMHVEAWRSSVARGLQGRFFESFRR